VDRTESDTPVDQDMHLSAAVDAREQEGYNHRTHLSLVVTIHSTPVWCVVVSGCETIVDYREQLPLYSDDSLYYL
jgi:hypothetical protein